eukprot:TRINITY_DN10287_c0_g1_i2.p1 TRINITY_DN10287_c0_g1~~TRINITY_DN10287_c0_g1_i2.p1  ORF type:complete len:174 (+),score=21.20 TRINITY_DN10287_c0_g1_i2:66-587(+)
MDGNGTALCKDIMSHCATAGLADPLCDKVFGKCEEAAQNKQPLPLCKQTLSNCLDSGTGVKLCSNIVSQCNASAAAHENVTFCQNVVDTCLQETNKTLCQDVLMMCGTARKNNDNVPLCGVVMSTCSKDVEAKNYPPTCVKICENAKAENLPTPMCTELCKTFVDPKACPAPT